MEATNSLFIKLPKTWLINSGVKRGDEIEVSVTSEGNLLTTPVKADAKEV